MPRKHRPNSFNTKPQSSAPSTLRNAVAAPVSPRKDGPSVNEVLQRLRSGQGQRHVDVSLQAQAPVFGSFHPSLRPILDIPHFSGPNLRPGVLHGGARSTRTRRVPGPPPPESWTIPRDSRDPVDLKQLAPGRQCKRQWIQEHSAKLPGGRPIPESNSLQHYSLKALTASWNSQTTEVYHYIANELSTPLKELLLSYMAFYADDVNTTKALSVLFKDDTSDVNRLDLSNQIAPSMVDVEAIDKALVKHFDLETEPMRDQKITIPESWYAIEPDEEGLDLNKLSLYAQPTSKSRFPNLLHLSLAIDPPSKISSVKCWSQLLRLAPHIPTIQSLSLAYWPTPALTARTILNSHTRSASLDYSFNETKGWRDAAGVLKSLSRSLYCLKWLDLTGCAEWFEALVWVDSDSAKVDGTKGSPDWNGSWRCIEYICLGVGWTPQGHRTPDESTPNAAAEAREQAMDYTKIDKMYSFPVGSTAELMTRLAARAPKPTANSDSVNKKKIVRYALETWNVEEERDKYYYRKEVEEYMRLWICGRKVAEELKKLRALHGGKRVRFDFGLGDQGEWVEGKVGEFERG